jgi:hypothetical protein
MALTEEPNPMDGYETRGEQMNEYEVEEYERPVPDDPDVIDRDPYIIPEPDDDVDPDGRPRPDEEEDAQRFPGDDPADSMIVR